MNPKLPCTSDRIRVIRADERGVLLEVTGVVSDRSVLGGGSYRISRDLKICTGFDVSSGLVPFSVVDIQVIESTPAGALISVEGCVPFRIEKGDVFSIVSEMETVVLARHRVVFGENP